MEISQELFDVLACPKCKGDLLYSKDPVGLSCGACQLLFPIREGIPVMLVGEAVSFESKKSE